MKKLLRKMRGVMGIGLTWGVLWAAIFAVLVLIVRVVRPEQVDPGEGPIDVAAIMGVVGLVSGVGFGVLLSFGEVGKAIPQISLSRAMAWGIVASAVYPLLTGRASQLIITCALGGVIAVGSIAIARKALRHGSGPMRVLDVVRSCMATFVRDAVTPLSEVRS